MTVRISTYEPVIADVNDAKFYLFGLPFSGVDDIEVWEIKQDSRAQVSARDYWLHPAGNIDNPTFKGGAIYITKDVDPDVLQVSIERNTKLDQTVDFPAFRAFPQRNIEYVLDRHTLICQELAYRKCYAVVTTPMTQLVNFGAYYQLKAATLETALNKIFTILQEIDDTAGDCSDDPELT